MFTVFGLSLLFRSHPIYPVFMLSCIYSSLHSLYILHTHCDKQYLCRLELTWNFTISFLCFLSFYFTVLPQHLTPKPLLHHFLNPPLLFFFPIIFLCVMVMRLHVYNDINYSCQLNIWHIPINKKNKIKLALVNLEWRM